MNIYTAEAALSVASLDLNLVGSVLKAIAAVDASGRTAAAATTTGDGRSAGYAVHAPFGYRSAGPAAYYDGVPAVSRCPAHRLDGWRPYDRLGRCDAQQPSEPARPTDYQSSVQPPWKVLPRPELDGLPATGFVVDRQVMLPPPRFDVVDVGRTLDLFV